METSNKYMMSFFRKPITNKQPLKTVSLFELFTMVHERYAIVETETLRTISDHNQARQYKGQHFDYVTPSGVFSYCSDASLVQHSGAICLDLDNLNDVEAMRQALLADEMFETLLLFRSPSGNGLKWFLPIDLSRCDHKTWFTAIRNYLMACYALTDKQVDPACRNVSRACYIGYDPDAYLKTELYEHF
jgi:hypothetical protein